MISKHDDVVNLLLDKVDIELLLRCLTPKERDTLLLWLNGGYSRQEIAEIIKIRYKDSAEAHGKSIGVKIQTIIAKLRLKINPKRSKSIKEHKKWLEGT